MAPELPKVLVVEDCLDAAWAQASLVELAGYEVRQAHDGAEALRLAAEFRPDVVLLDLGLPDIDGFQVAREIRQLPGLKEVRLVALTGFDRERFVQKSADEGFDHYLVKPADPRLLLSILGSASPA
ncbi:MAG TPA: response regulator [Gemmataceae bacterium]|nr:response regulator [Gemmataceae bacterium]